MLLQEWKLIHTTVQKLYLDTIIIDRQIQRIEQKPMVAERVLYDIENAWISQCEPKSKKLQKVLDELHLIDISVLDELRSMLDVESSLHFVQLIRAANRDNENTLRTVKSAFYALVSILIEVLNVADVYILEIAGELNGKLSKIEGSI